MDANARAQGCALRRKIYRSPTEKFASSNDSGIYQKMDNIRKNIIDKRKTIDLVFQKNSALAIASKLISLKQFKASRQIAIYISVRGEIATLPIIEAIWVNNKLCYLPVVLKNNTLQFVAYEKNDKLILNQYKIPEPIFSAQKIINPENLDLVIVPLVGFDEKCNRLGSGAGFYDRTFACKKTGSKPLLIGIAYEIQKTKITPHSWDIPLDMIITEKETYVSSVSNCSDIAR